MLEKLGQALTFYAWFAAGKTGKTGITVTVNVYEGTTSTPIVASASATELGQGLYYYTLSGASVDAAGEYTAIFSTADATVDYQDVPGQFSVGRAGVGNLDAAISSRSTLDAAGVWAHGSRTLTAFGTLAADVWAVATRTLSTAPPTAVEVATAVWANGTRTLSSFGTLVADVWANATRSLTDKAGFSLSTAPPTSAAIATAVWHQLLTSITTANSIGMLVKTNLDALISSRSTLTAAQVWANATRSLTEKTGFELTTTPPTAAAVASAVWGEASRTLTAFNFNVTVGTNNDKTGYTLTVTPPTGSDISAAVWNRLLSDILTPDTIGTLIKTNLDAAVSSVSGGGGAGEADWTTTERAQIRHVLNIDGTKATPAGGDRLALEATAHLARLAAEGVESDLGALVEEVGADLRFTALALTQAPSGTAEVDMDAFFEAVPPSDAPAGSFGASINLLSQGRVTYGAPVDPTTWTLNLAKGSSYTHAAGTVVPQWSSADWIDLTGVTVTMRLRILNRMDDVILPVTVTAARAVEVEIPGSLTATWMSGRAGTYALWATLPGEETVLLASGKVTTY